MDLLEQLPNPIEYLKDVRDRNQVRQQKQLFFEQQFQKMVANGNVEKAVELIHDEAHNIDVRINNDLSPEELAHLCTEESRKQEKDEFKDAIDLLEDEYGPFSED